MKRGIRCLAAAWILLSLALCGCGQSSSLQRGSGEVSGTVRNIDLEWSCGSVTVRYHPEDTVLLEEKSVESLPASQQMRWTLEGDTLRITSAKPGKTPVVQKKKTLTLTLPASFRGGALEFSLAAADLEAELLRADTLDVEAEAGSVTLTVEEMRALSLCTGSGSVSLTQHGSLDTLELSTATGNLEVCLEAVRELEAESASGAVSVKAQRLEKAEIETDTGDVELLLPEDAGFTARVRTGSGSFGSGFALRQEGETCIAGSGACDVEIATGSGNVRIDPAV